MTFSESKYGLYIVLILALLLSPPLRARQLASCAHPVLQIDFDGSILSGSLAALIGAVQNGEPLRVGWDLDFDQDGESDLSHWSEAAFLSVFEGQVSTQVQSIHRQSPVRGSGTIVLPESFDRWHGILDSRGVLRGRLEGSSTVSERQVRSVWCLLNKPQLSWRLVYRHDINGKGLKGSKAALLNAIRGGQALQIGWGLSRLQNEVVRSVEHTITPVFVTIIDGSEVVAQMPEHVAQRSYWKHDAALFDLGAVMWRGIATTQGQMDAIWVDRSTGEVIRRSPQRAAFSWYAQGPVNLSASLAVEQGVSADEERVEDRIPKANPQR